MLVAHKTALVTGASHGIGFELCRLLARDEFGIIMVARNRESMEQAAATMRQNFGVQVTVIVQDLAAPQAAQTLFDNVQSRGLSVDVLVNNAGFGLFGRFAETDPVREMEMVQVNIVALTELSKLFLPGMVGRKWGRILNVASTAAFQAGPLMAVYYATKAYVLSFSEAIGFELKKTGVTVTALCPGPTKSGFQSEAKMSKSRLFRGHVMDAETVAEAGFRGMMRGKAIVVPGGRNKFLVFLVRLVPRSIARRAAWLVQREAVS